MNRANKISMAIMRSSLVWGALATLGFYALIREGIWQGEFAKRYFTGHWVEYVETAMFFVGMAGLALKAMDVLRQSASLDKPLLPAVAAREQSIEAVQPLLDKLAALPDHHQTDYLPRRLREALESLRRAGSADKLDSELKYLSETDAARSHSSYALLRIIIWAIPILGFLGTVIGITLAIASLSPEALEESLPEVTGGLGVAFDTTALALGLSMVLMFVQFLVSRTEDVLLERVDARAAAELSGRFEQIATPNDPQVAAVRWMADAVIKASERLVERQAQVWQASLDAAQQRWAETSAASQAQIQAALAGALTQSLESHADRLSAGLEAAAESNRRHWARLQEGLAESAEATKTQQAELARQGEILLKVIDATGQVTRLEQTLNANLAALAGAQHFEETLLNLSGAVHLLMARIGQATPHIELKEHPAMSKAA